MGENSMYNNNEIDNNFLTEYMEDLKNLGITPDKFGNKGSRSEFIYSSVFNNLVDDNDGEYFMVVKDNILKEANNLRRMYKKPDEYFDALLIYEKYLEVLGLGKGNLKLYKKLSKKGALNFNLVPKPKLKSTKNNRAILAGGIRTSNTDLSKLRQAVMKQRRELIKNHKDELGKINDIDNDTFGYKPNKYQKKALDEVENRLSLKTRRNRMFQGVNKGKSYDLLGYSVDDSLMSIYDPDNVPITSISQVLTLIHEEETKTVGEAAEENRRSIIQHSNMNAYIPKQDSTQKTVLTLLGKHLRVDKMYKHMNPNKEEATNTLERYHLMPHSKKYKKAWKKNKKSALKRSKMLDRADKRTIEILWKNRVYGTTTEADLTNLIDLT